MKQIAIAMTFLLISCSSDKSEPPVSYKVNSHVASSGEWVLIRIDNEKRNRVTITAICDFYKWAEHERVDGPDSCNLVVGQTLVPVPFPKDRRDFLDIWQLGDKLFITQDEGPNRIHQQFSIKSAQVEQR